ncbi:ABC transporter ATP-binding protein [Clostridium ihumii]|uniref:ABC transporter ATP-binding protein n=1 Tax=Clostridium ihumii TaxID=1470356 RepID=UPI00058F430F|nr:ABC transporter ATP-binding protein [Clostridium ihumii]
MIEVRNLCKSFKVSKRDEGLGKAVKALFHREYELIYALKDVSFKIEEGEMVGYIGPNGAGKSTTIKIMSGILNPDSGECIINGRTPWKDRINHVKDIGVVFGQRSQLWWDVPVVDSFSLIKDIYKVPDKQYKKNIDELVEMLNIKELIKMPTRQLSLGQRMRCEIAASLIHSPKILFLDEPTIGLDSVSKIAVREFIKNINKERKTTVILTTHDTQDLDALTNRIILIGKGQVLLDGKLDELKEKFNTKRTISLNYSGKLDATYNGLKIIDNHNEIANIEIDTSKISVSEGIAYLSSKVNINDIQISSSTVEDVVVGLYREYKI